MDTKNLIAMWATHGNKIEKSHKETLQRINEFCFDEYSLIQTQLNNMILTFGEDKVKIGLYLLLEKIKEQKTEGINE